MSILFDHEKLEVYHASLHFISWSTELVRGLPRSVSAVDQLDRASTSVPLNIAEGNGKSSMPERCRFLGIAKGSALECAACLDVLVAKQLARAETIVAGKQSLASIVRMLASLIQSCRDRVGEDPAGFGYVFGMEKEQEQEKEQE